MTFDGDIEEDERPDDETRARPARHNDPARSEQLLQRQRGLGDSGLSKLRANMQRMQAALTRTQPSKHSCEMRLAIADWLHRQLRRGKLHTNNGSRSSKSRSRGYRTQLALLRYMLHQQLDWLGTASAPVLTAGARTRMQRGWHIAFGCYCERQREERVCTHRVCCCHVPDMYWAYRMQRYV